MSPSRRHEYGLVFFPNLGGKITVPVEEWIATGPPGPRKGVTPMYGVHLTSGEKVPVSHILPLRFRNSRRSRRLIRWGLLKPPSWHTAF